MPELRGSPPDPVLPSQSHSIMGDGVVCSRDIPVARNHEPGSDRCASRGGNPRYGVCCSKGRRPRRPPINGERPTSRSGHATCVARDPIALSRSLRPHTSDASAALRARHTVCVVDHHNLHDPSPDTPADRFPHPLRRPLRITCGRCVQPSRGPL